MMTDPLAGSPWSRPDTVSGFRASPPNETLLAFAALERRRQPDGRAIDIGCGAARNAVPLAEQGWRVLGLDWSQPMLDAAAAHAAEHGVSDRIDLALSPMDHLAAPDAAFDLIVAHGIWNLAKSGDEFRRAIAEAARVARPAAGLFVFTFSRHTLPPDALPMAGESFVFTQFSGAPQCFLTRDELIDELAHAGFELDPSTPFSEHNLPRPGALPTGRVPVIYEATFRLNA
jgi:2-polyprenyl-3-methyl-5-hydroxy-6-metoxy-1,4-benzoquinol methylase